MRKFIKKLKNSIAWKLLKILFTLVKWVVEIVIIGIAIIIITQRVTNSQKAFLGIRILLFLFSHIYKLVYKTFFVKM